MSLTGAVLTGGMSKRMGQDKADVLISDHTMLEMVGAALRQVCDRVVLLGPGRDGWETWPDTIHAHGPLAGIATALHRADDGYVVVVAVDQPFVSTSTLSHMIEMAGDLPLVPVDDHGVRQVTCAVYPTSIAALAAEEADSGGSIQSLLDRVSFDALTPEVWRPWGEDGRSWHSIDSPEALAGALALYQEERQ